MGRATAEAGDFLVHLAWGTATAADLLTDLLGEPVAVRHSCPACGSDRHGRPTALRAAGTPAAVSVAHAGALTLVATTTGRIGVDLESTAVTPPPGVRNVNDPPDVGDLELWVLKEAYLKATGDGLRRDPATVALDDPGAVWGRVPLDGYVAAWCVVS